MIIAAPTPPVVLAPMAGITNVAYRRVCREFGSPTALYVCEMITARAVVERDPTTMQMITFGADEHPRSLQLYSVDPATMREAVHIIASENLADHCDVNLGWRKSTDSLRSCTSAATQNHGCVRSC